MNKLTSNVVMNKLTIFIERDFLTFEEASEAFEEAKKQFAKYGAFVSLHIEHDTAFLPKGDENG